ncbi:FAD binding domain-containing protein [Cladophialophora immunda]|nr:FAD binding domain-containing protein [Cladophialophora immunda]
MGNLDNVSVIVAGAGFGGLTAAIELRRKGASVKVFEATKELTEQGDTVQIPSNATKTLSKWGDVLGEIAKDSAQPKFLECQNSQGTLLVKQVLPGQYDGYPILYPSRGRAHKIMFEYAKSIGVEVQFGTRISRYFENEHEAGVFVGDEQFTADAVIAADGVHSKARAIITDNPESSRSSGFAAYRCWFPVKALPDIPLLDDIINAKEDRYWTWIGPDVHALVMTNVKMQWLACFCTHRDDYTAEESWSFPGRKEDLLKVVEGWDEKLRTIFESIPPEKLIDWKLLWRDPVSSWVSRGGRIALVGDSAHPHLPSSGQGAAQAIEDGATIGAVLDRAGKTNIPLGLRVYEKLRFTRVNLTQRMGWELRHLWHETDWEAVQKNPKILEFRQPYWLFGGDPEAYAYEAFDEVVECLNTNQEFVPKNVPEGYRHKPWTMEDMLNRSGRKFVVYD